MALKLSEVLAAQHQKYFHYALRWASRQTRERLEHEFAELWASSHEGAASKNPNISTRAMQQRGIGYVVGRHVGAKTAITDNSRQAGKCNTVKRASRYAREHDGWRSAALAELHEQPKCSTSKLVTAIISRTGTKARRETVRAWLAPAEKCLHREAIIARRAANSLG